jgi:hypothetical protein
MEQADLLALQLVGAAFLLDDVLDERRGAVPVGHRRVEDPREGLADRRRRQAIGHRQHRNVLSTAALGISCSVMPVE